MLQVMNGSSLEAEVYSPLHERMRSVAGTRTFRHLSELTGTHPETVRRYMSGQPPSTEYLSALCHALNINGDWMLTGRGPMRVGEIEAHALRSASAPDLLSALAATVERLIDRVELLERYLQSMESHFRTLQAMPGNGGHNGGHSASGTIPSAAHGGTLSRGPAPSQASGSVEGAGGAWVRHESSEAKSASLGIAGGGRTAGDSVGDHHVEPGAREPADAAARVERILDAVPKRSPETDRGGPASPRR